MTCPQCDGPTVERNAALWCDRCHMKCVTCCEGAAQADPGRWGGVSDGFGATWFRCGVDCDLEVVRPGRVQCRCDGNP